MKIIAYDCYNHKFIEEGLINTVVPQFSRNDLKSNGTKIFYIGEDMQDLITNIKNVNNEDKTFSTLGTNCGSSTSAGGGVVLKNDLRIRKLTPKECFRLMGVKDKDFEKIRKNQSDNSLYHLAGDSIVVNVLMAIFKEML